MMLPDTSLSPLARLVLFLVCLAIFGSAVAGLRAFISDTPQPDPLSAPENRPELVILCDYLEFRLKMYPGFEHFIRQHFSEEWKLCQHRYSP